MLELLRENKVTIGAAVIVLSALGANLQFSLPVDAEVAALRTELATHISMDGQRNLSSEINQIRWEIKGVQRDLRLAEEQGWPPHDIQDLKELLQWYEDRLQQLLDEMRRQADTG